MLTRKVRLKKWIPGIPRSFLTTRQKHQTAMAYVECTSARITQTDTGIRRANILMKAFSFLCRRLTTDYVGNRWNVGGMYFGSLALRELPKAEPSLELI